MSETLTLGDLGHLLTQQARLKTSKIQFEVFTKILEVQHLGHLCSCYWDEMGTVYGGIKRAAVYPADFVERYFEIERVPQMRPDGHMCPDQSPQWTYGNEPRAPCPTPNSSLNPVTVNECEQ